MSTFDPTVRLPPSTTPDNETPSSDAADFVDPDDDEDCRAGLIDVERNDDEDDL